MAMVQRFAEEFGISIAHDNQLRTSAVQLFRRIGGVYMVQLQITPHEGELDKHYVTFDAESGEVVDNEPRSKILVVDGKDKKNNELDLMLFKRMFPRAKEIMVLTSNRLHTIH